MTKLPGPTDEQAIARFKAMPLEEQNAALQRAEEVIFANMSAGQLLYLEMLKHHYIDIGRRSVILEIMGDAEPQGEA